MKTFKPFLLALAFAATAPFAISAHAQAMDHSKMGGMNMPGMKLEMDKNAKAGGKMSGMDLDRARALGCPEAFPAPKAKKERNARLGISRPPIPKAIHPLVMRHPDTGREILYVSKGITRNVIGMPRDESSALLKELHQHSTRPENVYAHDWQVGDLVMFDTLGTLHRRDAWDPSERRVMRQLSTLWTPFPELVGIRAFLAEPA